MFWGILVFSLGVGVRDRFRYPDMTAFVLILKFVALIDMPDDIGHLSEHRMASSFHVNIDPKGICLWQYLRFMSVSEYRMSIVDHFRGNRDFLC